MLSCSHDFDPCFSENKGFQSNKTGARPSARSKRVDLDLDQIWLYLMELPATKNGSSSTSVESPQRGSGLGMSASFTTLETARSSRRSKRSLQRKVFTCALSPPHITKLFPPKKLTQDVYFHWRLLNGRDIIGYVTFCTIQCHLLHKAVVSASFSPDLSGLR